MVGLMNNLAVGAAFGDEGLRARVVGGSRPWASYAGRVGPNPDEWSPLPDSVAREPKPRRANSRAPTGW